MTETRPRRVGRVAGIPAPALRGLALTLLVAAAPWAAPRSSSTGAGQPGPPPAMPRTGWIIISGARSTAEGCLVLWAYEAGTGRAFVHDGCTGRAEAGSVPAGLIGELASALLGRTPGPWRIGDRQVTHTWRWVVTPDVSLVGELPWDDPRPRGRTEPATNLVHQAAVAFSAGCAGPLPPPGQVLTASLPQLINPVSADASQELTLRYRVAREAWSDLTPCRR